MNDELLALVLEALDGSGLDDGVADLVLAACDGGEALDAALGGAAVERPAVAAALDGEAAPGAYLAGLEVEGFRGIGPRGDARPRAGPGPDAGRRAQRLGQVELRRGPRDPADRRELALGASLEGLEGGLAQPPPHGEARSWPEFAVEGETGSSR